MSSTPYRFARGWFVIAWSGDLSPGEVKKLRYFDQDLVLFRTEDGRAVLLDAICPHLGAHLGVGGRVVGDRVVCPFHAWEFGTDGVCARIPYASKIPPRAKVSPWPLTEADGVIYAWHDPAGGSPDWDVPAFDGDPAAWTPWFPNVMTVKTKPREIVENVADSAHFPTVHRTMVSSFANRYEGHRATQETAGMAYPKLGGKDPFDITATYHGPAFQLSDMRGVLHARLLLAHTPVDDGSLDLRFAVRLERKGPRTAEFAQAYVDNLRMGFHEDIAIWEHKAWRDRPTLVAEDGPIGRLRAWYQQFFRPIGAPAYEAPTSGHESAQEADANP